MGSFLDTIPLSGIIRIRDLMYSVKDPYRLDQGDMSFDVPDSVKAGMVRAIAENRTHYLQTTGVPRLLDLLAAKLREKNGIPVGDAGELFVGNGGLHVLHVICQALLEPGDEVLIPDPVWPPAHGCLLLARAVPVRVPLYEAHAWRYDLDELERAVTPRTRAIYVNTPHNPTGGMLGRADLERIAALARDRNLWVISDEAYEDVTFDADHVSLASLPGMYARTIPLYTFSKSYAMTGLRLGYAAIADATVRARAKKALFYSTGNVNSIVQYGAIGALEAPADHIGAFRDELRARRDLFYGGLREVPGGVFTGAPPAGAFYAFPRINPDALPPGPADRSISWAMTEYLIKEGRIGSVPGVDFGPGGEGHLRFCLARERSELLGALDSMTRVFTAARPPGGEQLTANA
jgi:aspartate aminotransferase